MMKRVEDNFSLGKILLRYPSSEQTHWLAELNRLTKIIEEYGNLRRKRRINKTTEKYDYLPVVLQLCQRAACTNHIIVAREPHRACPPAPDTLDRWHREFKRNGLLAFLRSEPPPVDHQNDNRKALVSPSAITWINSNYRKYRKSGALYKALALEAKNQNWIIPSRSWLARQWKRVPEIVKVSLITGKSAYISKYAPYVPRNYDDLDAL